SIEVVAIPLPANPANGPFEALPRCDAIEDLEKQNPKDDVFWCVIARIDYVSNQELADTVRGAIRVREAVRREDSIGGPGGRLCANTTKKNLLTCVRETPVRFEDGCWSQKSATAD